MLVNKIKALVCLAFLGFCFALTGCKTEDSSEAFITGFAFKSINVTGSINQETKVITVSLPESIYEDYTQRALLKADITLASGTSLVTLESSMDFSYSPVLISVACSGDGATYSVNIQKKVSSVSKNSVFFTEYYSGCAATYKGANNQYIEITNVSSSDIDLSALELNRYCWTDGVRDTSHDQSVTLSGTLKAGAILVLYSNRCAYFTGKTDSLSVIWQSDELYNGIIQTGGQDGFTLTSNGTVLDALGPEDGNGSGWNWGVSKLMQRKATVTRYTSYKESEWVTSSVENTLSDVSSTAGKSTESVTSTEYKVTYFALEGLSSVINGIINNSAKTITVNIPDVYDLTQKVTVSTLGQRVRYNKKDVVSGETEIDFSKDNISLLVYDNQGNSYEYSVICNVIHYNFDSSPNGDYKYSYSVPKDGDVILIYYPVNTMVMGTEANGSKLTGVSADAVEGYVTYSSSMASLCVTVDDNGYYTFTNNSKYLTSGSTGSSLTFESAPGDYSLWKIVESTSGSGVFRIVNVNAKYGTSAQSLEYYSGFTTYTDSESDSKYQYNIYIKE